MNTAVLVGLSLSNPFISLHIESDFKCDANFDDWNT